MPKELKFEIVTIHPGFVMGPPLRKEGSTSIDFVKMFMTGMMPAISGDYLGSVDVREVAEAHLLAVKKPEAANNRYLLVQGTPCFHDYARPVIDKYSKLGWPCTK